MDLPERFTILNKHEKSGIMKKILSGLSEIEKAEIAFVLKLSHGFSDETLYMAMLEASAKVTSCAKVSDLYGTGIRKRQYIEDIERLRGSD